MFDSQKKSPMIVAFAGAGTVGGGALQLLRTHANIIAERCGRQVVVGAVAVRDVEKARSRLSDEDAALLVPDWHTAATLPEAEVVVELMGGETDAKECIKTALNHGKAVVTANKALLAEHGDEIFAAARDAGKAVAFEAAVAGCIPIIKTLREALAGDDVHEITGIINGTCNYILSAMSREGLSFDDALNNAQSLGYAEADPGLDIDGVDAAHKIALIARLAFNAHPSMNEFPIFGLRNFDLRDIHYAEQLGFCVKLLAQARRLNGGVELSVQPTLVAESHPLAAIHGATNAVLARSVFAGETMYSGAGAGGNPTAVAVVADIADIARGNGALFMPENGNPRQLIPASDFCAPHYLRLRVIDRPGVLASIASALAEQNISIEAIHQNESAPGQEVDIMMLLHETARGKINAAAANIEKQDSVVGSIVIIPIRQQDKQ